MMNNSFQEQQSQQHWTHPAQWGRRRRNRERNGRDHDDEQGVESSTTAARQNYSGSNNSNSPSIVVPWSPWSPPGRATIRQSSSRLLEEQSSCSLQDPLLSTPPQSRSFDYMQSMSQSMMSPEEAEGENDEEPTSASCCSRWCFGCCCLCCRKKTQSRNNDDNRTPTQRQLASTRDAEDEYGGRAGDDDDSGFCCKFLHLLLTCIVVGILFHISGKGNDQQWTMTAGESRHVATADFGLTDTVQVVSHTPAYDSHKDVNVNQTKKSRGMAVYAMGNPHCPPLTGPRIVVDSPSQELVLFQHAWEYQFFYLNRGSTMQVTLTQTQGATNILVLQGSKVLARVQDKKHFSLREKQQQQQPMQYSDIALEFTAHQIMLERFSWTRQGSPIEFSFTSPESDVYVLLFDNAAKSEPATLQVKYHFELTTYNLDGLLPWCSHSSLPSTEETTFTCPPLDVSKAGCILVEAVVSDFTPSGGSNSSTNDKNATDDAAFFAMEQEVVQVTLLTTRKWIYIGILSILPSLIIALYRRHQRKKKQRRQERRYYRALQQQQQRQQRHRPRHASSNPDVAADNTRTNNSRQLPPGAMFHFLPAHHDDQESDVEEQSEEKTSEQQNTDPNSNAVSTTSSVVTANCPHATEATMDNGSSSGETTLVPAENIMVLNKNDSDRQRESQEGS